MIKPATWRIFMRRLTQLALSALVLIVPALPVSAEQFVPLARVAAESHLNYSWLSAERAVVLSGPGLVLLFRPGESLYEVNDRVESAATTPRYAGNDIIVSSALAAHIEWLARQAQFQLATEAQQQTETQQQMLERASSPGTAEIHGSIALEVHPLVGQDALLIKGQAPPSAPIMITLLAILSKDIPNVVVSRHNIEADSDGRFQAIIPIGPDYVADSYLRVIATSGPGVTEAVAQVTIAPPNAGLTIPWEVQPTGYWP
jgi:hypothetical protein